MNHLYNGVAYFHLMTHTYYPPAEGNEETRIDVSLKKIGLPIVWKNLSVQHFTRKTGSEDWIASPFCPAQEGEKAKQQFLKKYQGLS